MKKPRWVQMTLQMPDRYQDLLTGQLAALGFDGFLQEDGRLIGFIESRRWSSSLKTRLQYCLRQFHAVFPRLRLRYSTKSLYRKNWNRMWERSIHIIEPAPGIVVKPSWRRLRKKDKGKIVLHIDPKMSFGTGHHETTRICLRLLQQYIQPSMSVLDFGSGTGILAIAAIKLGAKRAVAIDNDAWTIPNIKENLTRNGLEGRVRVILGDSTALPETGFDLIVANVDLPTIAKVHRQLVRRLRKGGLLLFSGLLTSDLIPLHKLVRHLGLSPLDIVEENDWTAIALVRT